jgi:hypothetical protein
MLVAGTVMWGISNVSWFQNKVAEETRPHGMHDNPAVPRQMPRAPRLAAVGPTTVTPYSVRS